LWQSISRLVGWLEETGKTTLDNPVMHTEKGNVEVDRPKDTVV
jgi:hypothetical protein